MTLESMVAVPSWSILDSAPRLEPTAVQLWRIRIDEEVGREGWYVDQLDPSEKARAARFKFRRDQQRYAIARGSLRSLLALAVDCRPADLTFCVNPHGKPTLQGHDIQFNVTHSGDFIVHALTRAQLVGVDVERIRPLDDVDSIASSFAPEEVADMRQLPKATRHVTFFTLWTCKEAYMKGVGKGLSKPLNSFSVSLAAGGPPRLLYDREDPTAAQSWHLLAFSPGTDHVGCLAVDGPVRDVSFVNFSGVSHAFGRW
ncbi:MAG: 4'-phosphopantetheinyl transferase superfamily protein [Rhodospirillales bacterium]|nr:4'-phosphopantetheinyl transferase superfamily protein [Rhodospirillales bacterium]